MREPGRSVVGGLSASGSKPTYEGVVAEHRAYVGALRAAGAQVMVLPPLEAFPDSVFVEDPALVFAAGAIRLRPGAPSRRDEARELAPALEARFPRVLTLSDGFADGGDVLVTPREVLIGLSARTDAAGAAALARLLDSLGFAARVVDVPAGTLHLKTDCSLVDEETILATPTLAASGLLGGYRLLVVPDEERHATNALRINDVVLMRDGCPRTRELLERHGLAVRPLPTDEIAKIDAGLSCMSLRWFDPQLRFGLG
ncbi:MAG TPA: arginine deiminase family protein [Steroidobacteraceae bacterium]|nr:arginine deiminase family protein [Steroidobacteraceae bacterium]